MYVPKRLLVCLSVLLVFLIIVGCTDQQSSAGASQKTNLIEVDSTKITSNNREMVIHKVKDKSNGLCMYISRSGDGMQMSELIKCD